MKTIDSINYFLTFAYKNRKIYQFGHTFQKITGLDDIKVPAIVLQHHPDVRSKYERKYIFSQENALEKDLEQFIEQYKVPLVGVFFKSR